jgi:transmembrane 9 superfamily protein 2/4
MRFLVVCVAVFRLLAPTAAAQKPGAILASSGGGGGRSPLISEKTAEKLRQGGALNRGERKAVHAAEKEKYIELRQAGQDEVSNTEAAAALRNYRLRNKKRTGLIRKRKASLADVLFPGVAPVEYAEGERLVVYADLVESRKTPIPYEFYDLPMCDPPHDLKTGRIGRQRKNLGSRLQGHAPKPAPFGQFKVAADVGCTPLCQVSMDSKSVRWVRRLVQRQYRVQLQLDQLPVLMRSKEYNYAVRGYPIGFQAPSTFEELKSGEYYMFNHLKFIVTYLQDDSFQGIRVTGFDVHPISIRHELGSDGGVVNENSKLPTCNGGAVENDPSKYLPLRLDGPGALPVVYSYEVEWEESSLPWSDRWDVYLVGAPDDDLHYFSIVNSLMIVLFLTGAISTIMIRTLRKDISIYNDMDSFDEGMEESGWKLVHGDIFRPPQHFPMLLSVLVGTGCQLGAAFALAMIAAMLHLVNPVQKGQTLTSIIVLYVLCGSIAGFVSARIYKFTEGQAWKLNTIMTATGLPGSLVIVFCVLNLFLGFVGAATHVSFLMILVLFLLWVCVSAPLVFIGAFFGMKADKIEVPTKTKQIARIVPPTPWHVRAPCTMLMGGILPFGSVCIELAFIMSALWLHQIYYVMGFLFAVMLILAATCAQVSIVLTYLQLCAEDHRWWWSSYWNCASAGGYLFVYSLWFLISRLELVGVLPVIVYLTYMSMISIIFGFFCGSVGFLSSFWFTRTIYGAVKVD